MKLSCHCKNINIEAEKPESVTQCNCSICSRYGSLWAYYQPDEATIHIGADGTRSYCWGDKDLDFIHCAKCGCVTHYTTRAHLENQRVAINFGMAREQVSDVAIRHFNGAEEL